MKTWMQRLWHETDGVLSFEWTLLTSLVTSLLWLPAGLYFGWSEVPRGGWTEVAITACVVTFMSLSGVAAYANT